jgi:hypothetical protein
MPDKPLTEDDSREWEITFQDADVPELVISAAYPTSDEKLTGWTVLKDYRHKIVAAVRDEAVLSLHRRDARLQNPA